MFADRRLLHIYGQWNCVCGGVGQCGSDIGGGGAGGAARAGVGDSLLRHDGRARDGHLPNHAVVRTARTSAQHTLAAPHWGHTGPPPNRGQAPKFSRIFDTLWSVDSQKNQNVSCHQMPDFKDKMHQI